MGGTDVARTREGGHSTRRIIHAGGDATGAEVQRALGAARLPVLFGAAVARVLTDERGVTGVLVLDARGFGVIHAPAVLLATGGLGQLYACSTNPAGATADGIALAVHAGAVISDIEFVQFHPTVLFAAGGVGRRPLVSEAVRGEGAILVDSHGRSVTAGVHPPGISLRATSCPGRSPSGSPLSVTTTCSSMPATSSASRSDSRRSPRRAPR